MHDSSDRSGATAHAAGVPLALLWALAAAVAALGSGVLFDALPGVNWLVWTGAAVAGLLLFARRRGESRAPVILLGGAAVVIAGAATVTASPGLWVLICLSVAVLLAMATLLTTRPSLQTITPRFAASAPLFAFYHAARQTMRRAVDATQLIRSGRARAWVRGLAITLPVLLIFALLLAGADPIFATWRDSLGRLIESWEFAPRVVFFGLLLVIVLGAYGYAAAGVPGIVAPTADISQRWLGSTERLMLLGSVAALFWFFLAVQLGYLFGNLPQIAESGVTYAEYARRGFGELSVVASASALLVVVSERYGQSDGRARLLRLLTYALLAAVLLLLASAFRRVWLYEEAYGFTTSRLYAQVYMSAVAAGLLLLAVEVASEFDAARVFRRASSSAILLFIALIYWNHEAWIADRNIDRFARTGQLDVDYLTKELSSDAVPTIAERLPSLPDTLHAQISRQMAAQFADREERRPRAWFEWNVSDARGRRALQPTIVAGSPVRVLPGDRH